MQFNKINKITNKTKDLLSNSINKVIKNNKFIMGPDVEILEKNLLNFTGSKFCLGVSSGTDALLISLMALGVKRNDEVIVPSFSWISTASVIKFLEAKPIFVDIERDSCNIDIEKIEKSITKRTKCIIFVSLFGNVPNIDQINKIGKKYKLHIIEDGAQSFGAEYKNKKSCNLTTIGCTSFFPSKPLGSFGDAGAIFTNNRKLFLKMKAIRVHGQVKRGIHNVLGLNARIDTLQCAILNVKLGIFEKELKLRKKKFDYYYNFFKKHKFKYINLIRYEKFGKSAFAQFCILSSKRKFLLNIFIFVFSLIYLINLKKIKYRMQFIIRIQLTNKKFLKSNPQK